ncbi:MAG: hypothetical protein KDC38_09905 [Planctomycetes bacterium]|nr:hypothetical protein [Planctomycetota bacterium]
MKMRKLLAFVCMFAMFGAMAGCATTERSTIFSLGYWKRHFKKFGDDLHQFRLDVDRTIFDLDDRPIEDQ